MTRLFYVVPPAFERPMAAELQSAQGKDSVLQCMGTGYPEPEIEWKFQDLPLNHTSRHFLAAEGKLLVIVDTEMTDEGEYTCVMRNNLGTKRGTSMLKVFEGCTTQTNPDMAFKNVS